MDAQSLVVTPYKSINQNIFQDLIEKGFRRSGQYIYKPNCKSCTACIPIRLPVQKFLFSKTQKRIYKKYSFFKVREAPLTFKHLFFLAFKCDGASNETNTKNKQIIHYIF